MRGRERMFVYGMGQVCMHGERMFLYERGGVCVHRKKKDEGVECAYMGRGRICVYGRGGVCMHGERRMCVYEMGWLCVHALGDGGCVYTEWVKCAFMWRGCVHTERVECACMRRGRMCVYMCVDMKLRARVCKGSNWASGLQPILRLEIVHSSKCARTQHLNDVYSNIECLINGE